MSTSIDAAGQAPVLLRNEQGFLTHGRSQDVSKLVRAKQTRVYLLKVGSLTGKTEELARAFWKRQETRWSGVKSCEIERKCGKNGYKLLSFDSRDAIKEVERFDDRLMSLPLYQLIALFTYPPHTERST